MRSDYFSLSECCFYMRISSPTLLRIAENNPDFPLIRVGGCYIIPKRKFFRWYYGAIESDGPYSRKFTGAIVDHRSVTNAHERWLQEIQLNAKNYERAKKREPYTKKARKQGQTGIPEAVSGTGG